MHLAAQAGVRHSLRAPNAYIESNIVGTLNVLEGCRHNGVAHLVYASSSSVYGAGTKLPYSVLEPAAHPVSLYAATKRANELMAHSYSSLFDLPTTGLRFFTVFGPWGRPDMALFLFARAILEGKPISATSPPHRSKSGSANSRTGIVGTMQPSRCRCAGRGRDAVQVLTSGHRHP